MLEELISYHQEVMKSTDIRFKRYLYDKINWKSKSICIHGGRGVGKTTMMCQYYIEHVKTVDNGLYITADHIQVASQGLLSIANDYFAMGGKVLLIDEIHKYPNWSIELKNIIDGYRNHQIIFTGSSSMQLKKSKADLSRRAIYHVLPGLSFREYLEFNEILQFPAFKLSEILASHMRCAELFKDITVLKHFNDYLKVGFYPFFLEGVDDYLLKLNNVIEKIITEDIAFTRNIKQSTIIVLKKMLWLIATSKCFVPNYDNISTQVGISRAHIHEIFEYLEQAELIQSILPTGRGKKLIRKPRKIFISNTNLLNAINGNLKLSTDAGTVRETFFANQLSERHAINTHGKSDFTVEHEYVFEVGGKNKTQEQIHSIDNAYLALDNIQIGSGNRIPLYLFGCLY